MCLSDSVLISVVFGVLNVAQMVLEEPIWTEDRIQGYIMGTSITGVYRMDVFIIFYFFVELW